MVHNRGDTICPRRLHKRNTKVVRRGELCHRIDRVIALDVYKQMTRDATHFLFGMTLLAVVTRLYTVIDTLRVALPV